MFSFANPEYFLFLLLLPVVVIFYVLSRISRRRNLNKYGKSEVLSLLMPDVSTKRHVLKLVLELLLLVVIITMLARPRLGTRKVMQKSQGIEVVLAIDVSNSMDASSTNDAGDISRLQKAKFLLEKLIDRLDGNKVGLVVFAGNAYMQAPMTIDVQSTKMYLSEISTEMASTQGTAIGAAINMSRGMFNKKGKSQKAIIVITDGENQEDDAVEAARDAKKDGIQVNVIGVGAAEGSYIITEDGYRMTDDNGQEVLTRLNETMANDIAKAGKGIYVNGNEPGAVDAIEESLSKLAQSSLGQYTYSRADEQFPLFATIALVLLTIIILLRMKRNNWLSNKFKWLGVTVLVVSTMGISSCNDEPEQLSIERQLQHELDSISLKESNKDERNHIAHGNKFYNDSNYVEAEVEYRKALDANNKSIIARYNLATTLIRQGIAGSDNNLFQQADSLLKETIDMVNATDYEHNRLVKNHAFHNLGNLYYAGQQWQNAIELYKMALRYNPDDNDARYNLRMAQLKQQEQQGGQEQQNQQNQDDQQNNQDNQDNKDNQEQNQDQNQNQDNKANKNDKPDRVKEQQRASERHDQNSEPERDKRVMDNAKLKPVESKKKEDSKQNNDKDENNQNNNENRNPDKPNQNNGQQGNQGNMNQDNALQILNAMQQREKETGKKVKMREEAIKGGERSRTRNKW